MHSSYAVHHFDSLETTSFCPKEYSFLKFGQDSIARKFGYELADGLFESYSAELIANRAVVIPSPYNHVKNAATVMTGHFVNRLNHHLVSNSGEHCDYSTIHRKVSYVNDYGFLPAAERKKLIDGDDFYFNPEFYKGKLLIFIDDVFITGTHELKLKELLDKHEIRNRALFAYYGMYHGNRANIEADINLAGVKTMNDFLNLVGMEKGHHMIVRPIKFILGSSALDCEMAVANLNPRQLSELYYGCLGEGYYKIPNYQENFRIISEAYSS